MPVFVARFACSWATIEAMSKPLQEVAVQVSPADNVAVVKFGVEDGESVTLADGRELSLKATNPGHRFALTEIPAGEFVRQYNQPIGTSQGIGAGEAVTPENMSNEIPVVRDLPDDLSTPAPELSTARRTFQGFRRSDGRVGTRNFILIVPASMCASHESTTIATIAEYTLYTREKYPNVDGVVATLAQITIEAPVAPLQEGRDPDLEAVQDLLHRFRHFSVDVARWRIIALEGPVHPKLAIRGERRFNGPGQHGTRWLCAPGGHHAGSEHDS